MQLLQSAQPVHFLSAVNPDVLMVVSIVGMSLLTLIAIPVGIVFTCQWSAVRKREATVVAVQDMLEKGFTAEQIRDVLEAGGLADHNWQQVIRRQARGVGKQAKKFYRHACAG
ncbi:hypothetical protein [Maioricimonas sp. JC845]|uniref:hypothetical protein n=1 Tax=Maioricimonas sp. JC845 TaxID=3232138 RepID=UPI003458489F